MAERGKGRRSFLNWLLGTSVGALFASAAYPVGRFLSPPEIPEATTRQVEAGRVNDAEFREKGFKIVRFGMEPVIVVRVADGLFRAFAATCTHLDCIVEYREDRNLLWCNCHNGQYDLDGQVVGGPPPHALESYAAHVIDDVIVVEKS